MLLGTYGKHIPKKYYIGENVEYSAVSHKSDDVLIWTLPWRRREAFPLHFWPLVYFARIFPFKTSRVLSRLRIEKKFPFSVSLCLWFQLGIFFDQGYDKKWREGGTTTIYVTSFGTREKDGHFCGRWSTARNLLWSWLLRLGPKLSCVNKELSLLPANKLQSNSRWFLTLSLQRLVALLHAISWDDLNLATLYVKSPTDCRPKKSSRAGELTYPAFHSFRLALRIQA